MLACCALPAESLPAALCGLLDDHDITTCSTVYMSPPLTGSIASHVSPAITLSYKGYLQSSKVFQSCKLSVYNKTSAGRGKAFHVSVRSVLLEQPEQAIINGVARRPYLLVQGTSVSPMTPESDYARTDTYLGHISSSCGSANTGHRLLVVMESYVYYHLVGSACSRCDRFGHDSSQYRCYLQCIENTRKIGVTWRVFTSCPPCMW